MDSTSPFEPCNFPLSKINEQGRNHWYYCACPARKFWVVADDGIGVTILYARCDKHLGMVQDGAMHKDGDEISREVYGVYVVMNS